MNTQSETSCPEAVLASIAWYPDALDDEARGLVEAHAAACAACRDELAFVQGEREPELPLQGPEQVYAGVLARIEHSERSESGRRRAGGRAPALRAPAHRAHAQARGLAPRGSLLAAGLALALFCGAIGALGGLLIATGSLPAYETVTETPVAPAPVAPALEVVFRADARAEQVHAALRAIGGRIVSGPTQIGVYRVELAETADVAAAAKLLEGEGRGVAAFAQAAR